MYGFGLLKFCRSKRNSKAKQKLLNVPFLTEFTRPELLPPSRLRASSPLTPTCPLSAGRGEREPWAGDAGVGARLRGRLRQGQYQHVERVPGAAQAGQHRVRPAAGAEQAPAVPAAPAAQLPGQHLPGRPLAGSAPAPRADTGELGPGLGQGPQLLQRLVSAFCPRLRRLRRLEQLIHHPDAHDYIARMPELACLMRVMWCDHSVYSPEYERV